MISKTEYDLCKEIHYRDGEILELRYAKSKQSREIKRLNTRMEYLEKEYLNSSDHLDLKQADEEILELRYVNSEQSREIERLNARISKILEITPDVRRDDLFEYLKYLLIKLSHKEGNAPIDPDEIDVEYVETACRYSFPTLFDRRALLGNNDLHKIELADGILAKFGIKTMAKYEELVERGEIDVVFYGYGAIEESSVKGSRDARDDAITSQFMDCMFKQ